jgi:hypothetical protein
MGWTFGYASKANAIDEVNQSVGSKNIVAKKVVGNRYWMLVRTEKGAQYILLALLKKDDGVWGVKYIDESMGPCYYDCPLSLLNAASPPPAGEYAAGWREKVRQFHGAKADLAQGTVITLGEASYQLHECLGRKGWSAWRLTDKKLFRLPNAMLNRNLV